MTMTPLTPQEKTIMISDDFRDFMRSMDTVEALARRIRPAPAANIVVAMCAPMPIT